MKKRMISMMTVFALVLVLASGCAQSAAPEATAAASAPEPAAEETGQPVEKTAEPEKTAATDFVVTDLLGREVTIPANAERFVAIGPGCLRLYCYTADVSKLVGIEQIEIGDVSGKPYAIVNEALQQLDIIGQGGPNNAPDAEKLLVAAPDVIFTMYNSDPSAVDELQQKTGIPVVALSYGESEMFDPAVDQSIELIGKVTGNEERAAEVIAYFASLKADLASRVQDVAEADKPLVYMGCMSSRGMHGIESTTGNFSIFNAIGARNAVTEAGITEYVMLDKEKILEMDPDYIFLDGGGVSLVVEDYAENAAFYNSLKAFKENHVYMHMPYNYYYTNIGVAIADAYYMGTILYPEQFADVDPAAKFDEIIGNLLGGTAYAQMAAAYRGGYQQLSFDGTAD